MRSLIAERNDALDRSLRNWLVHLGRTLERFLESSSAGSSFEVDRWPVPADVRNRHQCQSSPRIPPETDSLRGSAKIRDSFTLGGHIW
jgi:hypothetical protein